MIHGKHEKYYAKREKSASSYINLSYALNICAINDSHLLMPCIEKYRV